MRLNDDWKNCETKEEYCIWSSNIVKILYCVDNRTFRCQGGREILEINYYFELRAVVKNFSSQKVTDVAASKEVCSLQSLY